MKSKCFGDVSLLKPSELPDMDLFTYSFPCTDISVAGQQKGIEKGQTRSGLLYECEKIIEVKKPKYLLMENVKNLVGKKFIEQFQEWLDYLESLGYSNYWKVLNAKDYGIPQNRERVFVVSILNDEDKNYQFPNAIPLDKRLKDILEEQVDEKFYLSDEVQARFKPNKHTTAPEFRTIGQRDLYYQENSIMGALVATDYKQPKQLVERIGGCFDTDKSTHQAGSVYNQDGLSPTLDTMQGGYRQPCIMEEQKDGFVERKYQEFIDENGYVPKMFNPYHRVEINDIAPTQTTYCGSTTSSSAVLVGSHTLENTAESMEEQVNKDAKINAIGTLELKGWFEIAPRVHGTDGLSACVETRNVVKYLEPVKIPQATKQGYIEMEVPGVCDLTYPDSKTHRGRVQEGGQVSPTLMAGSQSIRHIDSQYRIRKLTPKECWRLMGCSDEDFYKAEQVNSNSQLYKQAGNSIVVNVLEGIFKNMFLK